ncbi:sulfatase-like hydrolase/transferase [uncultured Psychromonas sp.]|uniref:sulfatase-like hydrolase/transferase n=1 Tax=uncultured Psychromonas sp. TaxID=173974 RepID=UPI002611EEB0|nr:sulfatase-like hydrolase/transferase [uncultured Psychromonas sp.]
MLKKPNILIFMTDQQRGDTLNNQDIFMPNTRELMVGGIHFNNTYCPSPHCCPSRASFFTGLYPTQHGVWNNVCVQNALSRGLNAGSELFSDYLKDQDYSLYFAGKWHVCFDTGPEDYGYEELLVTCNKEQKNDVTNDAMSPGWDMYKAIANEPASIRKEGEIKRPGYPEYIHYGIDENPFNDRGIVDSAIEKLKQIRESNTEKPWSMYIGTLGPHDPYFVPQAFLDMYADYEVKLSEIHDDFMLDKPFYNRKVRCLFDQLSVLEKKDAIRHYMAFCTYEDYLLGLVLTELKQHPDFDNTLILATSDHGDYNGEHGLWCKGLPAFKGAYHIPAVAYWKNGIENPGRVCEQLVSLTDFAPTFLEVAGTQFKHPVVGNSLASLFKENEQAQYREFLFTQTNGNELYCTQRSVFNLHWKLVHNPLDTDELYDLNNDPNELCNRINDPKLDQIKKNLHQQLWQFAASVGDQNINPYIMVGMAEYGPAIAYQK